MIGFLGLYFQQYSARRKKNTALQYERRLRSMPPKALNTCSDVPCYFCEKEEYLNFVYTGIALLFVHATNTLLKIVSLIRKYHNHKLNTNRWHRKEEPHYNHETPGRQTKLSNQLFLPHHDDCKTRMTIKQSTTKQRTFTESHNWSNNQHRINNNRTTVLKQTVAKATRGLK